MWVVEVPCSLHFVTRFLQLWSVKSRIPSVLDTHPVVQFFPVSPIFKFRVKYVGNVCYFYWCVFLYLEVLSRTYLNLNVLYEISLKKILIYLCHKVFDPRTDSFSIRRVVVMTLKCICQSDARSMSVDLKSEGKWWEYDIIESFSFFMRVCSWSLHGRFWDEITSHGILDVDNWYQAMWQIWSNKCFGNSKDSTPLRNKWSYFVNFTMTSNMREKWSLFFIKFTIGWFHVSSNNLEWLSDERHIQNAVWNSYWMHCWDRWSESKKFFNSVLSNDWSDAMENKVCVRKRRINLHLSESKNFSEEIPRNGKNSRKKNQISLREECFDYQCSVRHVHLTVRFRLRL